MSPPRLVDAEAAGVIERAVRELADDGIPALWVTHNRAQAARTADRVLHVDRGRCIGLGPAALEPGDGPVAR